MYKIPIPVQIAFVEIAFVWLLAIWAYEIGSLSNIQICGNPIVNNI